MQTNATEAKPLSRDEMLAYIEMHWPAQAEKLRMLVGKEPFLKTRNVYAELYSDRQIDICSDAIVRTEYFRSRILELTRQRALSVKELAEALGANARDTLQAVVELRRKNLLVIDVIKDRSPLYRAVE